MLLREYRIKVAQERMLRLVSNPNRKAHIWPLVGIIHIQTIEFFVLIIMAWLSKFLDPDSERAAKARKVRRSGEL